MSKKIENAFKYSLLEYDESLIKDINIYHKQIFSIFNHSDMLESESDFYNMKTITINENSDFSECEDYNESEVDIVMKNAPIVKSRQIIFK